MNSRHLVDPGLLAMLDGFPTVNIDAGILPVFREQVEAMAGSPELPADVEVSEHSIPGVGGGPAVPVLVFKPKRRAKARTAILYIHGGGYIFGTARQSALECAMRALRHDCVVAAVDYRLAPETVFPGPLMDCYAALRWLYEGASEPGIEPGAVTVLGASAGGGLATALCLAARDLGGPAVKSLFLVYPMLDDRTGSDEDAAPNPHAGEFMWTAASNRFGWSAMRGNGKAPEPLHHFSPARAGTLEGLPPTYIAVGTLDLFVNENIDFARRLVDAGIPVELHVYPGCFHGFDHSEARIAVNFRRDLDDALSRSLQSNDPPEYQV